MKITSSKINIWLQNHAGSYCKTDSKMFKTNFKAYLPKYITSEFSLRWEPSSIKLFSGTDVGRFETYHK